MWLFFRKCSVLFKSPKRNYSKSLSWRWNLNFSPITVNNKFKFKAEDSNLEYFFFEDLEIWKMSRTFWIKATFNQLKDLIEAQEKVQFISQVNLVLNVSNWEGCCQLGISLLRPYYIAKRTRENFIISKMVSICTF